MVSLRRGQKLQVRGICIRPDCGRISMAVISLTIYKKRMGWSRIQSCGN